MRYWYDLNGAWMYYRPDAVHVWFDEDVKRRLSWYYSVMKDMKPAKFMIVKKIDAGEDPAKLDTEALWELHDRLSNEAKRLWRLAVNDRFGWRDLREIPEPRFSLLDVKVELAHRTLRACTFCERRCRVDRRAGKVGVCRLDWRVYVHSWFHHLGEEAPLVPSGTIFYGGCNFRCVFCQNWDISQTNVRGGVEVDAQKLAKIQRELRVTGARNINHVGGDPTPNLHVILESFKYLDVNVPQLWNSNMYLTLEAMKLLVDVIDIWLPDFKYGNDKCAVRLSAAPRYFEVVTRNLKIAAENGDMIIRHLVLPGHIECCTKPVLRWIAENLPKDKILVNIMDQYRPEYLVAKYPNRWLDIARRPTKEEIEEAYEYARKLGIRFEPVS
ncbi:Radical SAM domain protein [Pyrolobus fumarii 1A]|uniref:Radical SAM domain protein n=1 Tax=Pyrolobus fumarii (strain DSM 11204 / 1A) TaxID=694429 RepID=G0EHL7_PYRF1|nr:Radical SAM domain protein [Pyrolobus fumarii 1A]